MKRVLLGDIATISSGGTPDRSDPNYWGGTIPWVKTGEIRFGVIRSAEEAITERAINETAARLVKKGSLLMAMYGQGKTRGQVAILGIDAAINQACAAIQPTDIDDSKYLFQYLAAQYKNIRKLSNSGSQENLNAELIRGIPIYFPAKPERKRIADILGTWDEALEKTDALIAAQARRKQALMQQLLFGKVRLTGFANRWSVRPLGELLDPVVRIVPKPQFAFLAAGIRSHGKGVFLKPDFEAEDIALDDLFEIRTGDLILNITFAWEGAAAVVPASANGALVSHRFPTFRVRESDADISFLRHYILTRRFVFDCGLASPGGAGRNRVLNKSAFMAIQLSVPPASEQRAIGGILDTADAELRLLGDKRTALDQQKRGLMQQLFTGKMRVAV